jgi:hypothetical protein
VADCAKFCVVRVLASAEPAEDLRFQSSPVAVQTAMSEPAAALCQDPISNGPPAVNTAPIRSPAPQPPNVENAWMCSATPDSGGPVHTLQRTLPCAPPFSPPIPSTRSPSPVSAYQFAEAP